MSPYFALTTPLEGTATRSRATRWSSTLRGGSCSNYSPSIRIACARHVHGTCTACALHVHVHVHGMCMCMACACAWHVHGMCTACVRRVHCMYTAWARHGHGMGTAWASSSSSLRLAQVPTIQIFDGAGINRLANLDCQPAQFKQARAVRGMWPGTHAWYNTRGTRTARARHAHGTRTARARHDVCLPIC